MKKYKKHLFLIFSILFLFFLGNRAILAAGTNSTLEVTYPTIPGLPPAPTVSSSLSVYIAYWFALLIAIAGFLSLISFVIGAVGLINPSPEKHKDAQDRMKGAALGLVLTVAAAIIIQTINPKLANITVTPLSGVPGVYYTDGTKAEAVPAADEDTSIAIGNGLDQIKYVCAKDKTGVESGPSLLLWLFPETGLEGGNEDLDTVSVHELACGESTTINDAGSLKWEYDQPGVYYCLDGCDGDMCKGYMSDANIVSQDSISSPFAGSVKGVRIVSGSDDDYGIIFHQERGLTKGGECTYPVINLNTSEGEKSGCYTIDDGKKPLDDISAAAADIFEINPDPSTSGQGVTFYSNAFGWAGNSSGFYNVAPGKITDKILKADFTQNRDKMMCFDYTNVDQPLAFQQKCPTGNSDDTFCSGNQADNEDCSDLACENFRDCPGSIKVDGDYLVSLYSNNTCKGSSDCAEGEICGCPNESSSSGGGCTTHVDGFSCTDDTQCRSGHCNGNGACSTPGSEAVDGHRDGTNRNSCAAGTQYNCSFCASDKCSTVHTCTSASLNQPCPSGDISTDQGSGSCGSNDYVCVDKTDHKALPYCQTFNSDVSNLNAQPVIAAGGKRLKTIYVVPTQ